MNTMTCTRRWTRGASRPRRLALTLCFILLASGTGYAQGTAGDATSTGLSPGTPLTFTKLMLHAQGKYDFRWVAEDYHSVIISRLQQRGFSVHHSQNALFHQDTPPDTRFLLGGVAEELTCLPVQGGGVDTVYCGIAVTWELFDQVPSTVVYKVKTRGFVMASRRQNPPEENVGKLILGALDSLLSRDRFFAAMSDHKQADGDTARYPIIDTEDLTWQEQYERQNHAVMAEKQQAVEAWRAQQRQWEADTLPLRNKRKPYKSLGLSLSVIGGISLTAGGILEVTASVNHNRVKDYRAQWMESVNPDELEQLKQDIVDAENRRDLQHAVGLGTLSVGVASLITGIALLAIMPELPPKPVHPRYAEPALRLRPVIGAADLGLQVTF